MRKTQYRVIGTWKTGNDFAAELLDTMKEAKASAKNLLAMDSVASVRISLVVTTSSTVWTSCQK